MSLIRYLLRVSRVQISIKADIGYDTHLLAYYVIIPHQDVPYIMLTSTNYFDRARTIDWMYRNLHNKATKKIIQNNSLALTFKKRSHVDKLFSRVFLP